MLVDSIEFAEWLQYWELSAEYSGLITRDPTPEELGDKITAVFAHHNATQAAVGKARTLR